MATVTNIRECVECGESYPVKAGESDPGACFGCLSVPVNLAQLAAHPPAYEAEQKCDRGDCGHAACKREAIATSIGDTRALLNSNRGDHRQLPPREWVAWVLLAMAEGVIRDGTQDDAELGWTATPMNLALLAENVKRGVGP